MIYMELDSRADLPPAPALATHHTVAEASLNLRHTAVAEDMINLSRMVEENITNLNPTVVEDTINHFRHLTHLAIKSSEESAQLRLEVYLQARLLLQAGSSYTSTVERPNTSAKPRHTL